MVLTKEDRASSFSKQVRQDGLNSAGVIRRWLETNKAFTAAQLYIETDGYYSREAYRAVVWRMACNQELLATDVEGVYIAGPNLQQSVGTAPAEEIAMVSMFMPIGEVASLYQVARSTVKWCRGRHLKPEDKVTANRHKISAKQAHDIRRDHTTKRIVLARKYKVSTTTISNIKHYRSHNP